jgi:RHS repeat-associated protein
MVMQIKEPSYSATDYRYGFNGKEKDPEGMGGGGSTYDYGFRIYNPQIAKFLSIDPLSPDYPWYTPYQFAGNSPTRYIDLDGLEEAEPLQYNFFKIIAPQIKNNSDTRGLSLKGVLFVMAHTANESGYAKSAIKAGDFNIFGVMAEK